MEARAILRHARITPMKARRVVNLIRGKKAGEAMAELRFMPYRGAKYLEKLLRSAMANAEQKEVAVPEDMRIVRAYVDEGPVMKRLRPRAMGRANVIKKKTSHITIVLAEEEEDNA
jgi:large subunit ribosomal protein L22